MTTDEMIVEANEKFNELKEKGYATPAEVLEVLEPTLYDLIFPPDEETESDKYYTAKQDNGKAKLSLVPQKIIWAIARVREYGNNKYPEGGKNNWKNVENARERYTDALLRHISAYVDDPDGFDKESGIRHLHHAACNIAFLIEMEEEDAK